MKNTNISIISEIIIRIGSNCALKKDLKNEESINNMNPKPIINPLACERSFILYINRNIIIMPKIVPKTKIGNKFIINVLFGARIIKIVIILKKTKMIICLNFFN